MAFQLAQIVAELVERVRFRRQLKRGEDGIVNLSGGPAADRAAVMQQDFEQTDDPGVMNFDSGITN